MYFFYSKASTGIVLARGRGCVETTWFPWKYVESQKLSRFGNHVISMVTTRFPNLELCILWIFVWKITVHVQ